LRIKGVPFGTEIKGFEQELPGLAPKPGDGSIIVIIATDAPLLPWQLSKLCKRVSLGIGSLGAGCQNGSGDICLAFSTANPEAFSANTVTIEMLSDEEIDPFYRAVAQAVEEEILNAIVAAKTMEGRNRNKVYGIPHDQVKAILEKYKILFKQG
jgi:D-aminopeptidase